DGNMLPTQFKSALLLQAVVNGNGYARIYRDLDGITPIEIKLIDANAVTSYYNWYEIDYGNNHKEIVNHQDMIHLKGLSSDGVTGMPIWDVLATALKLSVSMRRYAESYFRNNCRINMVLQLTKPFKNQADFDKFKSEFMSVHRGADQAFTTALVRDGAELKSLNQGGNDDTLIQLTEQQAKAIAVIIGIPVSFLGYADSYTSHNSLESQQKQLLMNSLNPWLVQFEQACEKVLLFEKEKDAESHYIECNRSQLVSVDVEQEKLDIQKVINGLWAWEEYREKYNLPLDMSLTYFLQSNTVRVDSDFEPPQPEPVQMIAQQQPDQQSTKEAVLRSKTVEKLITRVAKAVEAKGKAVDLDAQRSIFCEYLDCYDNHQEVIDNVLGEMKEEINALSSHDLNKIDFDRYKSKINGGLK
ncbi:MAG: phage portal protein, partial [Planctomycetaceae bacterium]